MLKNVRTVFKKEVKDILRDKKTIFTSIFIPMFLIPLLNILVGGGVEKLQRDIGENITVALSEKSDSEAARNLVEQELFKDYPNIRLVDAENPVEAVKRDEIRIVLELEEGYAEKLESGKPFAIKIYFDRSKAKSEGALGIVIDAINQYSREIVKKRISALGLDVDVLEPVRIEESDVAGEKQGRNPVLLMMLPMMLGMLVAVGGIPAATDLVAGEKERNTLEPLLATKPGRLSILLGKYLTVTLFSFVSIAAIIAGMTIGYLVNPNSLTMGISEQLDGFYMPTSALLLALLALILLGMSFAGVQIALSTYARSFKEAQTYLSFLIFIAMIPGYATMFMQPGDIQFYMFLLPVLNTISAFKMVLGGMINYTSLAAAIASSFVFMAATLALAASFFNKEEVLFRS